MKKLIGKIVTLVFAVVMALCCVSCSGGPDTGESGKPSGNTNVTLKIQSAAPLRYNYAALLNSNEPGSQIYNQALFSKRLVEGFKELYPNIKLQFIEDGWGDALYQKQQLYIRDANAGGKMAVDIMIGETYMGYFAQNGVFAQLDSTKFEDVVEGSYADTVVDGKMYCVPMCTGIFGLQYNETILREAGIVEEKFVPATWAELLENCKKVSEYAAANNKKYSGIMLNNVAGMSSAFRALPFMRQAGGDFVDAQGNLAINSEANQEAFAYLRELAQYAYPESLTTDNEDTLQNYFITRGYAAYMIEGQWSMANATESIKSASLPVKSAESAEKGNCFVGNVLFGITAGSTHKEEAQKFLEYLTSEAVQTMFYELDGRLPINKQSLSSEEIREIYPNVNPYIDSLLAGGFGGALPGFTKNASDVWSKWSIFYKSVLTSKEDIGTLCAGIQSDISELIQ